MIWTSALFLRQVFDFFTDAFGMGCIRALIWIVLFFISSVIILKTYRERVSHPGVLLAFCVIILLFIFAYTMRIPEERVHLVKYGILGYLVSRDLISMEGKFGSLAITVFLCVIVSSIDELFQWFLPYRVGDVRDVGFAVVGGSAGGFLMMNMRRKE